MRENNGGVSCSWGFSCFPYFSGFLPPWKSRFPPTLLLPLVHLLPPFLPGFVPIPFHWLGTYFSHFVSFELLYLQSCTVILQASCNFENQTSEKVFTLKNSFDCLKKSEEKEERAAEESTRKPLTIPCFLWLWFRHSEQVESL